MPDVSYASLWACSGMPVPRRGLTSWQAMFDMAGLASGQRLLVTNSSGDVGSLAVQLAKAHGSAQLV